LVKEKDKYRASLALQISNLWTRGIFCERLGISDVPQSCAFFSAVDIDHVLRKEVDMDCITPSNQTPIPPGESLDITTLLAKKESNLGKAKKIGVEKIEVPSIKIKDDNGDSKVGEFSIGNSEWKEAYLKMQISKTQKEFTKHWKNYENGVLGDRKFENSAFAEPTKQKKTTRRKKSDKLSGFSPSMVDSFFEEPQRSSSSPPKIRTKPKSQYLKTSEYGQPTNLTEFIAAPNHASKVIKTNIRSYKKRDYTMY